VDTLSPFGRLAVTLDTDFSELSRLSGQIQRLDLDTDGDLDHAVKLLNEFTPLCAGDHRRHPAIFPIPSGSSSPHGCGGSERAERAN